MTKQIDVFGNEIKIEDIISQQNKGRPRYRTMQEIYGYNNEQKCKTCKHKIKLIYHGKTYYKCNLWHLSKSSATDIRLKDIACNKWEGGECKEINVWS